MNRKRLRLKPVGVIVLVLTAVVLLLGIQNIVLISRNQTIKEEIVSLQEEQLGSSVADEQIQELNNQIEKLMAENQTLMQSNIELQSQIQLTQSQETPAQITTDDTSATPTPDSGATSAVQTKSSDDTIEDPYSYIDKYESQYNLSDPLLFRAIMALETGWFTSYAYVNQNNPCGATGSNGVISYESKDAGFSACYANWDQRYNGKTIEEIAPIYAPGNTEYVGKVMSIYNQLSNG